MKCSKIIFFVICLFLFFSSNIIFAGKDQGSSTRKNQESSASKDNQALYEYYKNSFSTEPTKKDFLQLIIFFNKNNVSINETLCQLILRCDTHYCTKFMFNIKLFFIHEKFKNITIQQFVEWFDGDPQQLINFSTLTDPLIKQIATHPLLSSYISSLYKDFGFPNINEINILLTKMHLNNIQEQKYIIRNFIVINIMNIEIRNQLLHRSFSPSIEQLTKSGHLLLAFMHNRHVIVTDRFLLWIKKIPYHLFQNTCQKMIVFFKKLTNPFACDAIIDMITRNYLDSFVFCNDDDIEYIASLEKINDIMMIQQGQGFPNSEEIKNILKIKEIESMWPRLCIQFKGCSFSALPIILHFLKKNDQYDKRIEFYISFIKINNPHIQWSCIEINALHSLLYFLLSNNVKDILLLSHIFFNVSKNCFTVIDRMMRFFVYLDHHLINIRKLSGMLYSSDAIQMFIELPNNTLQLLAKYEKSNDIMKFLQEENSVLLKKWTEITNLIHRYSCFITKYNNPELQKQFTKLKMYWIIGFISINLDKEKIYSRWNTNIERDFIPVFEALLEKNIIIDDRLYATLFNHRKHRSRLCEKLGYLFSHQFFSQRFFEFFMKLLGNDDNYLKFMKYSNKDLENFLTNATHSNNSENFYF